MDEPHIPSPAAIDRYLSLRPRRVRWSEWLSGKRYLTARFADRPSPLFVVAHSFRDAAKARDFTLGIEQDWDAVPERCREAYDEILFRSPPLIVVQFRRRNLCGCLGHRHVVVKEKPFAEPHEALGGASVGELDIAFERVESWQALPLSETALDAKFLEGSRLEEFRQRQFRLRLLSILLTRHTTWFGRANRKARSARKASPSTATRSRATWKRPSARSLSLLTGRSRASGSATPPVF